MSVKRNALILAGGMTALIAYAHSLAPVKQIPTTPPSMVKIDTFSSDFAVAKDLNGDWVTPDVGTTQMYVPKAITELASEYSQGAQPVFTCPSGTAEKDAKVGYIYVNVGISATIPTQPDRHP